MKQVATATVRTAASTSASASEIGMRDLIVTENITLDGVIDAAEGWFNPSGDSEVDESDIVEAICVQAHAADALLVSRQDSVAPAARASASRWRRTRIRRRRS
jgi:hypothetical protein